MSAGLELPPEQVIEWLRSEEGERWSRTRIDRARRADFGAVGPSNHVLNRWHQRDAWYVPGLFSLREQAGYGADFDWAEHAPRGQPRDPAYSEDYWRGERARAARAVRRQRRAVRRDRRRDEEGSQEAGSGSAQGAGRGAGAAGGAGGHAGGQAR